eukprot:s1375_g8.t1
MCSGFGSPFLSPFSQLSLIYSVGAMFCFSRLACKNRPHQFSSDGKSHPQTTDTKEPRRNSMLANGHAPSVHGAGAGAPFVREHVSLVTCEVIFAAGLPWQRERTR